MARFELMAFEHRDSVKTLLANWPEWQEKPSSEDLARTAPNGHAVVNKGMLELFVWKDVDRLEVELRPGDGLPEFCSIVRALIEQRFRRPGGRPVKSLPAALKHRTPARDTEVERDREMDRRVEALRLEPAFRSPTNQTHKSTIWLGLTVEDMEQIGIYVGRPELRPLIGKYRAKRGQYGEQVLLISDDEGMLNAMWRRSRKV